MRFRFAVFLPLFVTTAASAVTLPGPNGTVPAVSPNGRRIAFVSFHDRQGDLFVMDADGGDLTRLTWSKEREDVPSWSADGRNVLYSTSTNGTVRVWRIGLDRSGPSLVAAVPSATSARLSHDGRRIVYARGSWTRNQLVVANLDGSGEIAISDTSAGYFNMAWSPDDRRIAVTRLDPSRDMQVWILNADGSGTRALTHFNDPDYGSPQWPAWSRDGKRIAIQSNRNSKAPGPAWIWIVDVATGAAKNITPHSARRLDEAPSWFPDGKRLAFQSDRSGAMEIWIMNADGSGALQLTR